jgi:hypothetical protein
MCSKSWGSDEVVDSTIIVGIVAAGSAVAGSVLTLIGARITSGPPADQVMINRFTALADLQEKERKKLEVVAADLEVMVIRLMEWADEVVIVAERRRVELPPRPKFAHHIDGRAL